MSDVLSPMYKTEMHKRCYITIKALKCQQGRICILLYLFVLKKTQKNQKTQTKLLSSYVLSFLP